MFRKPMRLEKWIAFDGVAAVEVAEALQIIDGDADPEAGGDDGAGSFALFAVEANAAADGDIDLDLTMDLGGGDTRTVEVNMPGEVDASQLNVSDSGEYMPFFGDEVVFTADGSGFTSGEDFYFEISKPDGGTFTLFSLDDVIDHSKDYVTSSRTYIYFADDFKTLVGLNDSGVAQGSVIPGMYFAFRNGDTIVIGQAQRSSRIDNPYFTVVGECEIADAGGGLRFHLTNNGTLSDNTAITAIFRSLVFQPGTEYDPAADKISGYDVTVYHATDDGSNSDLFGNGTGAAFHDDNIVGTSKAVVPDPGEGGDEGGGDGDGGDEQNGGDTGGGDGDNYGDQGGEQGNNEPIAQPPVDPVPVVPPPPPADAGSGDAGGSGNDAQGADGSSADADAGDSGGDSGDSADSGDAGADGGDGAAGGDMVYIYRREDAGADGDDADDADAGDKAGAAAAQDVEAVALEDRAMESAAAALALELTRDFEIMLTVVRGEREVLLGSLSRLQEEYLRRDGQDLSPLRDVLRWMFESGNREKAAVNRVIAEMNRQMEIYRGFDPEFRDGMLSESLRELVESAERRTGETGAISQALDAVAALLSRPGPPPNAAEVRGVFERTYSEALAAWRAKAELSDPMGRELAAAE